MNAIRLTLVAVVTGDQDPYPAQGPLVVSGPIACMEPVLSEESMTRFPLAQSYIRSSAGSFFVEESVDDIANMLDARRM